MCISKLSGSEVTKLSKPPRINSKADLETSKFLVHKKYLNSKIIYSFYRKDKCRDIAIRIVGEAVVQSFLDDDTEKEKKEVQIICCKLFPFIL